MSGDVEALAAWFHNIYTRGGGCMGHHAEGPAMCEHWVGLILASDWLAQRDAAQRAEELREAADTLPGQMGAWLRDRADRIGGTS